MKKYPLTAEQQSLWMSWKLNPKNIAYNISIQYRLKGSLNIQKLESAIKTASENLEMLRSRIVEENEEIFQIIVSKDDQIELQYINMREEISEQLTNEKDLEAEVQNRVSQIIKMPFDPTNYPTAQFYLIQYDSDSYNFLITCPRIFCDSYSEELLIKSIFDLYNTASPCDLGDIWQVKIDRFEDYLVYKESQDNGNNHQEHLEYWQSVLSGSKSRLEIGNQYILETTEVTKRKQLVFSGTLATQVKEFAAQNEITTFVVILAAFQSLLFRYSGETDICIRYPVNIRPKALKTLSGFYVNNIPLRTVFKMGMSFKEIVLKISEQMLKNDEHQNYYAHAIVSRESANLEEWLNSIKITIAETTLTTTVFQLQGIESTRLLPDYETAIDDLLFLYDNRNELIVEISYKTNLFTEDYIEQMIENFQRLLTDSISYPEKQISELTMLSKEGLTEQLITWNNTQQDYPQDKTIHQLFEEQVERTPDNVAVVFEDTRFTYRELNERANQLAHYLREQGVKEETLVALCVERSLELMIGILGILKAGGAYVPLDPNYPQDRLNYMLEDSKAPIVLTQAHLRERFNQLNRDEDNALQLISTDSDRKVIETQAITNPIPITHSHHLAYVIYTSGSTGNPKGVMIEHTGICALAQAQRKAMLIDESSHVLQFSSCSFDAMVWEWSGALSCGASLYLTSGNNLLVMDELIKLFRRHPITVATLPPSVLSVLPSEALNHLKTLAVAGETCSDALANTWRERVCFINAYGPTEVTVCGSLAVSDDKHPATSIGKPIENKTLYILDAYLQPLPQGVAGELYIGGVGLARGYLNRPELTKERFIENPFVSDEDKRLGRNLRLYRTGDLVRYLKDGNIEFLGRIDYQVKLRGYRIELGEIETALRQHPSINDAVVITQEDLSGQKRLVAYVTPKAPISSDTAIDIKAVRKALKKQLPDYMLPTAIVELARLPLTINGKVDRKALPLPTQSALVTEAIYVAPRTEIEKTLAMIWTDLLGQEQIGIHDNFFSLGGHSLLITKFRSKIRETFKVELSVQELFANPTIQGQLILIASQQMKPERALVPAITASVRPQTLPLSFAQQRLWFLEQLVSGNAIYNIPLSLRLTGGLNKEALQQSFNALVNRHESLRTTFTHVNGAAEQVVAERALFSIIEMHHIQFLSHAEQENALRELQKEEAHKLFNLEAGPLFRVVLVSLRGEGHEVEHVLFITFHHIIADGWSMGIFIKELNYFYNAFCQGQTPNLSTLAIQYVDYTLWQRNYLQDDVLARQKAYWKEQLKDIPEQIALPTDKPRSEVLSYQGGHYKFTLNQLTVNKLKIGSEQSGTTLYMTLLAAFKALLYRYSHQEDIVVGSPIANRQYQETEGLIGFFVNTIAIRSRHMKEQSFNALLKQIKEATQQAYDNQDVPFEQLVDELKVTRDLNRQPVFQVMFVLQSQQTNIETELNFNSITARALDVEYNVSKFDITLIAEEKHDEINLVLEYATDLFEASTIERMAGHFTKLLDAMLASPETEISRHNILTEAELTEQLVTWNDTQQDYPQDKTIHQLFEEQVERTPDNIAVVFEEQRLAYRELNERANQLAHYLREQGVQQETLVALCVERSLELMVGILGILKAGGAYVPLDPNYPQDRLDYMLEDSKAPIILTQEHLRMQFNRLSDGEDNSLQLIVLDSEAQAMQLHDKHNLEPTVGPANLAYMIYTSGSTGKPKGVMIEHTGICALAQAQRKAMLIDESSHVLQFSSCSFDAMVSEWSCALSCGASLYLTSGDNLIAMDELIKLFRRHPITVATLPPSVLSVLPSEALDHLKTLIVAGEACSEALAKAWRERVCFINAYGPTEVTVCGSLAVSDDKHPATSIGKPIKNKTLYILDAYLQPLPQGVAGELYIGGVGLARGYLNRPELTKERFIENPFASDEDKRLGRNLRLYRTGDLVRYLKDGNIEFLGRIDDQVKIRGFRIELGEIENVLRQQPIVDNVVVVAREDVPGEKRLVAYVAVKPGLVDETEGERSKIDIRALREALKQQLPEHMIPVAFVRLEKIPLNPNGKVDRKCLPVPEQSAYANEEIEQAPRTETEQRLAALWATLLRHERVNIYTNFFNLGGNSLSITVLRSKIREAFKVELSIQALFGNPTVAAQTALITAQQVKPDRAIIPAIGPSERPQTLPLSFAQQRLWFLEQLVPGSAIYNMPLSLRLTGGLNKEALQQSFNALVNRHESLRTTFTHVNGKAEQVVAERALFSIIKMHHIQFLSHAEQENALRELQKEEAHTPFALETGPLLRARLIRLGEEAHALLITFHHIIADGWSMGIFIKELNYFYNAFCQGETPNLSPLAIQYVDYAQWQHDYLQEEVLAEQKNYWKEALKDIPEQIALPTDKVRPKALSYVGGHCQFTIDQTTVNKLKAQGEQVGTTLYMTLLAGFKALLYRYCNQEDIVVGSPIANRQYQETEGLIGFFVNTVALRSRHTNDQSFQALLKQVKTLTEQAYDHQDVPFEQLVDELKVARDLNRQPIFQVMFVLQNNQAVELDLKGIETEILTDEYNVAKFDLTLSAVETKEGLNFTLEYATDLFEASTIERMALHFNHLLQAMLGAPEEPISRHNILSPAELTEQLITWNDTQQDYPQDKTIHQLFEEQVERTPGNVALVFEDTQLTYRELNERANQLAHYLREQGVKEETLVGISLEKGFELIIGLLGILKAGGAYVPLDPAYPEERLHYMLEDAKVPVIITMVTHAPKFHQVQTKKILLDTIDLSQSPKHNPSRINKITDLAYVIYTSGSTGKPKGVLVEHAGIGNLAIAQADKFNIDQTSKVLQFASVNFDVALSDIATTLTQGAALYLLSSLQESVGEGLSKAIKHYSITTIALTPSVLATIENTDELPHLKTIVVGGEVCPEGLLKEWSNSARVINAYGPSEATVCVSILEYRGEYAVNVIGRPLANVHFYILDQKSRLCPVGVQGELYIGGAGLARGYLNRPELTKERFIENPFASDEDKRLGRNLRLYRTGDLVRYLKDGNIEFLGRIDDQVKIRGFRIELGEIENVLRQQPIVDNVVVVAREDVPGEKRLVAYVAVKPGLVDETEGERSKIDIRALREALKQQLPEHMIPVAFVRLEKIPLNPNGKVDRKCLPVPEQSAYANEEIEQAPRTETEQRLAALWATLLRHERVNIYTNFFNLGGNSLSITVLRSKIREAFKVELSIQALFGNPTVAAQTALITAQQVKPDRAIIPAIGPSERPQTLPLSFAQQRLWFLEQLVPGSAIYNMPLSLRLTGGLNKEALQQSFNALVNRHESLRTTFTHVNGKAEQVVAERALFSIIEMHHIQFLSHAEQENALRELQKEEVHTPFALETGPLLRARLIRLGEEAHALLITFHHIIADGWSMGIFIKELNYFYNAFCQGETPNLSPLAIQYVDYAQWQHDYLQEEVLAEQKNYWKEALKDIPEQIALPTDKVRPKALSYVGGHCQFTIDQTTVNKLKAQGEQVGTTLYMTLLAGFKALLYRYCNQEDIVVGSPIANRQYQETEGLIGFFVNTVALRSRHTNDQSFQALLKQVKTLTEQAYDHQDVPFEQLVDELKVARDLNRQPIFQVMFVLQNNQAVELDLKGIETEILTDEYNVAKFDLTLSAVETKEGLNFTLEYATDLFEASTIERMALHFNHLLQAMLGAPEEPISRHNILSPAELTEQLITWNDTQQDYPQDKTIHQLFEEQVERTPDNVAVVFEDTQLTYRELNERANQLAHYLREQGVKEETLVALCVERSLELMIGILGILKAGGAYVPLDPNYPQDRLNYMLEDSKAPIVLTQAHLRERFNQLNRDEDNALQLISTDSDRKIIETQQITNPIPITHSHHLAYVIYTSGSTGNPKGVMIEHTGICALASGQKKALLIDETSHVLQFSSCSFDAMVWEWSGALSCGASLYLTSGNNLIVMDELIKLFRRHPITVATLPPSVLSVLPSEALDHLKTLIVAGEACSEALAKAWRERVRFINAYGPTEVTVCGSLAVSDDKHPATSIGKPIKNKTLYILDAYLQPLPQGVAGELYIGGVGLARGYLNRSELTKERFIENPFASDEDKRLGRNLRLYRTGDLVRYLKDGNVEFLGRIDYQVKLRGYRIELGEIEAALKQHSSINDAVVVAREDIPEQKLLVAYVTPKAPISSDTAIDIKAVREALKKQLPDYMLPTAIVELARLPLTVNGKVDRKCLPVPEQSALVTEAIYVAPRTEIEIMLVMIWTNLIRQERISIYDNFFKLGGDSLLLIRLVAQIKEKFAKEILIASIYELPTIFHIAHLLKIDHNILHDDFVIPCQTKGTKKPLFLVHPGGGLATMYLRLAEYMPDQPIYGISNPRFEQPDNPFTSIEEIASCYISAIKKVQPEGPYCLGGFSFGATVVYEMAHQLQKNNETIEIVLLMDGGNFSVLSDETNAIISLAETCGFDTDKTKEISKEDKLIKANLVNCSKLLCAYVPNLFVGRVVLVRAGDPEIDSMKEIELSQAQELELKSFKSSPDLGWNNVENLVPEIYSVSGKHGDLFEPECIARTATAINFCLSNTDQPKILQNKDVRKIDRQFLHAVEYQDLNIVKYCMASGADMTVTNGTGKTALQIAIETGNIKLKALLDLESISKSKSSTSIHQPVDFKLIIDDISKNQFDQEMQNANGTDKNPSTTEISSKLGLVGMFHRGEIFDPANSDSELNDETSSDLDCDDEIGLKYKKK